MMNSKYLPENQLPMIRERLLNLDDERTTAVQMVQFKDPLIALLLSIFCGAYGIDRFFIGDMGMGIGKLLTCGGIGIWTIVDWFLISNATREKNMEKLCRVL